MLSYSKNIPNLLCEIESYPTLCDQLFSEKPAWILLFILNFIVRPYGQDFQVSNSYLKHTINLNDYVDTWKFSIQSLEMVKPGGNSYANFILQEKVKATNKYPRKPIMLNPRSYNNFPEFLIENYLSLLWRSTSTKLQL